MDSRTLAEQYLRKLPFHEVGALAFENKRKRFGDDVTYTISRHVNPTNLCIHGCKFCDFAAKPKQTHAYELSEAGILESLSDPALSEVHIVGGLWPTWGFARSIGLVQAIRASYPRLWIKAFTAVEIAYFAQQEKRSIQEVLERCVEAGIDALPGGGAEILTTRVHQALYRTKIGPDTWLSIHAEAHRLGIPTNCTMLFGHIETDEEILEHLDKLRELQDRYGGFVSFIPLAYQPGSGRIVPNMASPERCLRIIALSRVILDSIPHIKAYWPVLQAETASLALNFGADDLDGTLGQERIMQLAGTSAPSSMSTQRLEALIRDAGQTPRRRSGRFESAEVA